MSFLKVNCVHRQDYNLYEGKMMGANFSSAENNNALYENDRK